MIHPLSKADPKEKANFTAELREQILKCQTRSTWSEKITAEIQHKDTDILGMVKTTKKPVLIPTGSEINLVGTTRQLPEDFVVVVEPTDAPLPSGLVLSPSLSTVSKGKVNFKLLNCTQNDITLAKPTRVAKITTCEVLTPEIDVKMNQNGDAVINSELHPMDQTWSNLPFKVNMGKVHMSQDENDALCNLFPEYADDLSLHGNDLGFTDTAKHQITTRDDIPIK